MLKLLVKKQLTEIFRAYLYDAKKNRARSKAATVGYLVFFVFIMVGIIGGMFTLLSLAMCRSMAEAGMSWFYFAIMGLMAILLGAFGSVFTTYSSLYLPKDNDQLLSLPIPVNTLIAARLLGVYLMGLMYSGVVVLPAIIVYWVTVSAAPLHLLAGVLFLLLISLFVMAISCLLGWVVAKVSLKLKNKSFVTVVLSLVFFGLYYYFFSFKANSLLTELLQNIALYGDKVRSSAYPVYLFGQAGAGDPLSMLLLTAAIAVLFGLTWLLLSRSFLSIATASGHVGRKVYRAKAVRCRSISSALLDRELRRFTSSANYMLNCGFGTLFLVLASGFLLWQGRELLELVSQSFPERSGAMPVLLAFVLCLLSAMNDTTAPSVSLEGKQLWLAQSLPVSPWQVLRAKLRLQLLITVPPMLLCLVCLLAVYPGSPLELPVHRRHRPVLCPADGSAGPVPGPENAQPQLDQRGGPHQAECLRGPLPLQRLGRGHDPRRPLSADRHRQLGPAALSLRRHGAGADSLRRAVPLGEKDRQLHLCRPVIPHT